MSWLRGIGQPPNVMGESTSKTPPYVLTRYWVLGTHDLVRIAARSHAGKVHTKLTSLYDRFRLVRVPLAKLKITGNDALKDGRVMLLHAEEDEAKPEAYRARSNDEYHPPTPTRLPNPPQLSVGRRMCTASIRGNFSYSGPR